MKKPRRLGGFTIIEIMIALGVIAIALFSMVSMISHTSSQKESLREVSLAKEAASKKLDELKGMAWTNLLATFTTVGTRTVSQDFPVEGLTYSLNPTYPNKGQGTCTRIFNLNPDLLEVEIRVEWQGVFGSLYKDSITGNNVPKGNTYYLRTMITR